MIKEITMYSVCCDNCGKDVNEDADYSAWNDKGYTIQCAEEADWHIEDDKHYCPDCFSWSDDDELILKPLFKKSVMKKLLTLIVLSCFILSCSTEQQNEHEVLTIIADSVTGQYKDSVVFIEGKTSNSVTGFGIIRLRVKVDSSLSDHIYTPVSSFNVMIGKGAGQYLTTESYCVIVGHSKRAQELRGEDMIWHVEWDEPYLEPDIKNILQGYYKDFILTNKDDKDHRKGLALSIINILNLKQYPKCFLYYRVC